MAGNSHEAQRAPTQGPVAVPGGGPQGFEHMTGAQLLEELLDDLAVTIFQLVHCQASDLVTYRPADTAEVRQQLVELLAKPLPFGEKVAELGRGGQGVVTLRRSPGRAKQLALKRMLLSAADVWRGGGAAAWTELGWGAALRIGYVAAMPPHVMPGHWAHVEAVDNAPEALAASGGELTPGLSGDVPPGPGVAAALLYPAMQGSLERLLVETAAVRAGPEVGPIRHAMLAGRRMGTRTYNLQLLAALLEQTLEGVVGLHACRVLHNDIKPGNVLLAGCQEVLGGAEEEEAARSVTASVADLGGATICPGEHGAPASLHGPTACVGTTRFMHPERVVATAMGRWGTAAAHDLWSLGVTLHDALLGPHQEVSAQHGATLDLLEGSAWGRAHVSAAAMDDLRAYVRRTGATVEGSYDVASLEPNVRARVASALRHAPFAAPGNPHASTLLGVWRRLLELGAVAQWAPMVDERYGAVDLAAGLAEEAAVLRALPYAACWVGVEPDAGDGLQLPQWVLGDAAARAAVDAGYRAALLELYWDARVHLGEEQEEPAAASAGQRASSASAKPPAPMAEGPEEAAGRQEREGAGMEEGPAGEGGARPDSEGPATAAPESAAAASLPAAPGTPPASAALRPSAGARGASDDALPAAGGEAEEGPAGGAGGVDAPAPSTWTAWGRRHALTAAAVVCPLLVVGAYVWVRRRRSG